MPDPIKSSSPQPPLQSHADADTNVANRHASGLNSSNASSSNAAASSAGAPHQSASSSPSLMCDEAPLTGGAAHLVQSSSPSHQAAVQNLMAAGSSSPSDPQSQAEAASGLKTWALWTGGPGDSIQVGRAVYQNTDSQARLGLSGAHFSQRSDEASADIALLEGDAFLGTENKDGSRGLNMGVGAVIASAEATLNDGQGNSLTLGGSIGVGAEASAGHHDSDGDGKEEYCFRVGAGPVPVGVLVGACVEPADLLQRLRGAD